MKLTLSEIESFQKIWFKEYGEALTKEEAIECAGQLVGLLQAFMGIDGASKERF